MDAPPQPFPPVSACKSCSRYRRTPGSEPTLNGTRSTSLKSARLRAITGAPGQGARRNAPVTAGNPKPGGGPHGKNRGGFSATGPGADAELPGRPVPLDRGPVFVTNSTIGDRPFHARIISVNKLSKTYAPVSGLSRTSI